VLDTEPRFTISLPQGLRAAAGRVILLHEAPSDDLAKVAAVGDTTLVVRPEGGFSENEIELARGKGCNFAPLGPQILRTEHAGCFAVAELLAVAARTGKQ
jgi:16S rRNA (uracil1498-N3)-methyltransferase